MVKASFNSDLVFLYKQWDKMVFQHHSETGSITMMPKPPRGNQLSSYIQYLSQRKIDVLVSLLQFQEVNSFALVNEGTHCETHNIEFINFQIKDHSIPQFFLPFNQLIEKLYIDLKLGKNIAIHCYAGIGRTGLTAAALLIKSGLDVDSALIALSQTRGLRVPETIEQITWLHHHAEQLAGHQDNWRK